MLKFPPELIVHKDNVSFLLCVLGGLVVTVTAGGQCVDVALRTAQNPANLRRLSTVLIRLVGLQYQIQAANSKAKRKRKRLYFTDSFRSLLDMTKTKLHGTWDFTVICWFPESPESQTNLDSTSSHFLSARRCRIYYVFLHDVGNQAVVILSMGYSMSKLKTYNPSNQLQWLVKFSRKAQERGDVIFLFLSGQTGQICTGSDQNNPEALTLVLSVLSVVFLWMSLPYIAMCAVICLGMKVHCQYLCKN